MAYNLPKGKSAKGTRKSQVDVRSSVLMEKHLFVTQLNT